MHMIGIGGSGMSALARLLGHRGYRVTGSDKTQSEKCKELEKEGIRIYIGHDEKNISNDTEEVVYSPAVPKNNPERSAAAKKHIPSFSYPQALGRICRNSKNICVAGTHGKTTVTAMIGHMLTLARHDPTVLVGANMKNFGNKGSRMGSRHLSVLEACEYKRSFHHISPNILVITNIDYDHADCYPTKKSYDEAFKKFIQKVPHDGAVIAHSFDVTSKKLLTYIKGPKIIWAKRHAYALKIPGKHNQENASLVASLGAHLGIPEKTIRKALKTYEGTSRRLESKGRYKTNLVFDDYAHHPVEIMASIQALRESFPKKRMLVIFQPHQFNRTKVFMNDFGKALAKADEAWITDIFAARDSKKDQKSVSPELLVKAVRKHKGRALATGSLAKTLALLEKLRQRHSLIVTMGAGSITNLGAALTERSNGTL